MIEVSNSKPAHLTVVDAEPEVSVSLEDQPTLTVDTADIEVSVRVVRVPLDVVVPRVA